MAKFATTLPLNFPPTGRQNPAPVTAGPLILHIPHSSTWIPARYRNIYLQPDRLAQDAALAADLYTDQLYRYPAATLRFPVSRLLCDVERFRDPGCRSGSSDRL